MLIIKNYSEFNQRRYSNPWIAKVNPANGKIDFNERVGSYTGGYNKGEAGQLCITNPIEGGVYAIHTGQKDYRGGTTETNYIKIIDGKIVDIDKSHLIEALNG